MAEKQINNIKLILIGGSSGSLEVIMKILPALKEDFEIPIIFITHRNNNSDSALIDLLDARSALTVKEVEDKDVLEAGYVYVVPPDYHLLIESDGTVSLDASERIHYSRPSIDVSFTSAAIAYKNQLAAILLSGANADGVEGLTAIKEAGGYIIVQDPTDASVAYMPQQALLSVKVDKVLAGDEMAELLNSFQYK